MGLLAKREHMQLMARRQPFDEREQHRDDANLAAAIDTSGDYEREFHGLTRSAPVSTALTQELPQRLHGVPGMPAAAQLEGGDAADSACERYPPGLTHGVLLTRPQSPQ